MARNGHKPKDHMSENKAIIKNVQHKNREERERSAQPQREAYKLSQFRDVEARVFDEPKQSDLAGKHSGAFISKGCSGARQEKLQQEARQKRQEVENMLNEARDSKQPSSPRKCSVPKADQVCALAPRNRADFIGQNKATAARMQPPRRDARDGSPAKHEAYGRVPDYLEHRNAQKAEAEASRRRNAPDPSCPPGMTLMPEDERAETVRSLEMSREEVMRQLQKLPFVIETISIQKRHDALESKLKEIERALTIFNKPRVYVAL